MQADGQELLQACTSEQWDVAEALIVLGNTLEAPDKVVVYVCSENTECRDMPVLYSLIPGVYKA